MALHPFKDASLRRWLSSTTLVIAGVAIGYSFGVQSVAIGAPGERVTLQYDQQQAELSVVIDGSPVARFSSAGLKVTGDLAYSGYLIDQGENEDAPAD